jgi:hypothetical protein
MKLPKFKGASDDAVLLAVGIVAVIVVYVIGKKLVTAGAAAVGGVVSGNNALTQGTDYQGTGVLGTLGAATNSASGGLFDWLGNKAGSGIYDLFNGSTTPAAATVVDATGGEVQPGGLYGN